MTANGVYSLVGDSTQFFGPYEIRIGCFFSSVIINNNAGFVNTLTTSCGTIASCQYVGATTVGSYAFLEPFNNRAWCTISSNDIVQIDGSAFSTAKFAGTGATPYTTFDLVSTTFTDEQDFKVKTSYPGGYYHLSPTVHLSI